MGFSATDAAFEGFRVVRRNPMALVFWALFYAVIMAGAFALMGPSLISMVAATERLEQSGATPTPEDFLPVLQMMGVIFAVLMPISLVASAMIYAAIARSVLQPARGAWGYLRLGADEMRVLAVSLVLTLMFTALIAFSWALIFGVGALAASQNAPALWLVAVLLFFVTTAATIWLAIRLSLAIPITVAEHRIALFDSFGLTRGRFWSLLGMAVIAALLSIVVGVLASIVSLPIQLMSGGIETLAGAEGLAPMQILTDYWPAITAYVVINAVLSALQVAVVYAPFSAAYLGIKGEQGAAAAP